MANQGIIQSDPTIDRSTGNQRREFAASKRESSLRNKWRVATAQPNAHMDPKVKDWKLLSQGRGEVSQVLFRLSRWENLEHAKEI